MLGLRCIHFDESRLKDVLDGSNANPDFRRYDDVDAVVDLPTAYFYRELLQAYPGSKVILTVRNADDWWQSIKAHFEYYAVAAESRLKHRIGKRLGIDALKEGEYVVFRRNLRNFVYGACMPREFLYKKRYIEHNERVIATVPADRLLIMNITSGEGWEKLCTFLQVTVPDRPFPHAHRRQQGLCDLVA